MYSLIPHGQTLICFARVQHPLRQKWPGRKKTRVQIDLGGDIEEED